MHLPEMSMCKHFLIKNFGRWGVVVQKPFNVLSLMSTPHANASCKKTLSLARMRTHRYVKNETFTFLRFHNFKLTFSNPNLSPCEGSE